jgi:glycosyltransferase involved in cell wall biosynthesis
MTDHTIRHADRVFVQSRQAFPLIGEELLGGKAVLISHLPPTYPPPPADHVTKRDRPYVLVVGELLNHKGVEVVIDSVHLLRHQVNLDLLVCGRPADPHYVDTLRRRATDLGVSSRLQLLGARKHEEVLVLMREALACVAASRFENLSRIPTEAMSVGAPVIAADTPSYREACGEGALFFPVDRPDELAHHIQALAESPSRRGSMADTGYRLLAAVRDRVTRTKMLDELCLIGANRVGSRSV